MYLPAGHCVHGTPPPVENCPGTQAVKGPDALVDPAGHSDPEGAVQLPLQVALVSPAEAPYLPAGHGVQLAEPAVLYLVHNNSSRGVGDHEHHKII